MRLLAILILLVLGLILAMGLDGKSSTKPSSAAEVEGPATKTDSSVRSEAQQLLTEAKKQGKSAVTQASEFTERAISELKPKFDQAAAYVEQKRPEVADRILRELEKRRSSMPESFQGKLDDLRQQVDRMKAASQPTSGDTTNVEAP